MTKAEQAAARKAQAAGVRPAPKDELAAMKKVADFLEAHPEKLEQLLREMKIHTPTGRVTKAYGG